MGRRGDAGERARCAIVIYAFKPLHLDSIRRPQGTPSTESIALAIGFLFTVLLYS